MSNHLPIHLTQLERNANMKMCVNLEAKSITAMNNIIRMGYKTGRESVKLTI